MISTVTTTTVTTVTIAGSLALASILTLLGLSIVKEVTTAAEGDRARTLGKVLLIGIVPLLMAFLMIAAVNIYQVLH